MSKSLPHLPYSSLQVGYHLVRLAGNTSKGQITGKLWRGKEFGAFRLGIATEEPGWRRLGQGSRICQAGKRQGSSAGTGRKRELSRRML